MYSREAALLGDRRSGLPAQPGAAHVLPADAKEVAMIWQMDQQVRHVT